MQPQANTQIQIFAEQVSGKSPKYTDPTNSTIFKKLSGAEHNFYKIVCQLQVQDPSYSLKFYIPNYKGVVSMNMPSVGQVSTSSPEKKKWIDHISLREEQNKIHNFLILENLLQNYEKSCIMDVKLGIKKEKKESNKKYASSTTDSHRFRINGVSTYFEKTDEEFFVSKYYGQKTTQPQIQSHLAFFFFNGKQVDIKLLENSIEEIKGLVLSLLKFSKGQFNSSSLFLCYDAKNSQRFNVKLIDFDKYVHKENSSPDDNIIIGLKNILQYLTNIVCFPEKHENILRKKQLKLFNDHVIVPKEKIQQFEEIKRQKQQRLS